MLLSRMKEGLIDTTYRHKSPISVPASYGAVQQPVSIASAIHLQRRTASQTPRRDSAVMSGVIASMIDVFERISAAFWAF